MSFVFLAANGLEKVEINLIRWFPKCCTSYQLGIPREINSAGEGVSNAEMNSEKAS